jgi:hypothetical protein
MNMDQYITYNGKKIEVKPPTLEMWIKLNRTEGLEDPKEFALNLIQLSTGLTRDEILEHSWYDIQSVSAGLVDYFTGESKKFFDEFEYEDQKYRFIDLQKMSFAEWIDIDTFLQKPYSQRKNELHFHLALLYRPVLEDGTVEKYDGNKLEKRAMMFLTMPGGVRYLNGALFFFTSLEQVLQNNTIGYFNLWMLRRTLILRLKIALTLVRFGGGIVRFQSWLKTTSQRLKKFFNIRSLRS